MRQNLFIKATETKVRFYWSAVLHVVQGLNVTVAGYCYLQCQIDIKITLVVSKINI